MSAAVVPVTGPGDDYDVDGMYKNLNDKDILHIDGAFIRG